MFNNDGHVFIKNGNINKPEVFIWVQGMKFKLMTGEGFDIQEANEVAEKTLNLLKIPNSGCQ